MAQELGEPSPRLDLVQAQALDELAQLRSLTLDDLPVGPPVVIVAAPLVVDRSVLHDRSSRVERRGERSGR